MITNIGKTIGIAHGTVLILALLSGCSSSRTALHNEIALRGLMQDAYHAEDCVPQASKFARHFERGWKQAYLDVSHGADGTTPSTAPKQYWSVKYQTPDGCKKIDAWYEGYARGVSAAMRDCRDQYVGVPARPSQRSSATECRPVNELRSPVIDDVLSVSFDSAFQFDDKGDLASNLLDSDETTPAFEP